MNHIPHVLMPAHVWRGITITELTPPDSTWQGSIVQVDVPAGTRHPLARSTKCESYYYCDHGELDFEIEPDLFHVSAGDLVVIQPGQWYSYHNTSVSPVRLLSFNIPPYDAAAIEIREE